MPRQTTPAPFIIGNVYCFRNAFSEGHYKVLGVVKNKHHASYSQWWLETEVLQEPDDFDISMSFAYHYRDANKRYFRLDIVRQRYAKGQWT